MSPALIAALFFTVTLLVTTAYFLLGSLPLLLLEHDTPLDARFVRGFLSTYCLATMVTAGATAVSLGVAGRPALALVAAGIAASAIALRARLLPKMEALSARLREGGTGAARAFRRLHITAIAVNLAQLAVVVGSLIGVERFRG